MYDPAIGRFHKSDRFAEKYLTLTPYQYTGNNPINFVDYNGDYIIVFAANGMYSVMYEEGKAYHYSKDKDGNYVKGEEYDGDDSSIAQSVGDLNKIEGTKYGNRAIDNLVGSDDVTNVTFRSNYSKYASYDEKSNSIMYGSKKVVGNKVDGVRMDKTHIRLGHEIGHAWNQSFSRDYKYDGFSTSSRINGVFR